MSFDALLREVREREDQDPPAPRSRTVAWLLVASVTAILLGVGAIVTTLLVTSGSAVMERIGAAQADLVPTDAVPTDPVHTDPATTDAVSADPAHAEPSDPSPPVAVDREWVTQVAGRTDIPERALQAYATAASRMSLERPGCGIGWNTLAGIGFVESEHGAHGGSRIAGNGQASPPIIGIPLDGRSTDLIPDTDHGVLDSDPVWDRAVGPMQFIPSTWANW